MPPSIAIWSLINVSEGLSWLPNITRSYPIILSLYPVYFFPSILKICNYKFFLFLFVLSTSEGEDYIPVSNTSLLPSRVEHDWSKWVFLESIKGHMDSRSILKFISFRPLGLIKGWAPKIRSHKFYSLWTGDPKWNCETQQNSGALLDTKPFFPSPLFVFRKKGFSLLDFT